VKLEKQLKRKFRVLRMLGLVIIFILASRPLLITNAQSVSETVTHTSEGDALALTFSPPIEFFENSDSSLDQFLRRRNAQPGITVTGAGASYQVGAAQPLPEQKMRRAMNRIEVQGAGAVKEVGIGVSPVEITVNDLVITAIGAGSIRDTQLELPVVEK